MNTGLVSHPVGVAILQKPEISAGSYEPLALQIAIRVEFNAKFFWNS